MTAAKIESKLASAAASGLEPYVQPLYATPGKRVIGVVELRHTERTEVAADEDKEQSVKLRISHLEIARPEQEEALRDALQALYLLRTAMGTLDGDGQLELSDQALRICADKIYAQEAARLRATVQHWLAYARKAHSSADDSVSAAALRRDLGLIADGLSEALYAIESEREG